MTFRTYWVTGLPIPQGSKVIARRGNKVWLRDVNGPKLKAWRNMIAAALRNEEPVRGPVRVVFTFYLPKPKRPRFDVPAVRPDVDKLCRSAADSLTQSGIIEDDSRIVEMIARKAYADNLPGVRISIWEYE